MMLSHLQLKQIILDQRRTYPALMQAITRSEFAHISQFIPGSQVLIITGIRRCGKSTLMQQIRQTQDEQDFYLSFEDERLVPFTLENFQALLEVFIELYGVQKKFYFDEIQNIPGWERFIRRLHDQGNKIYITGSNANLLSKELGTRLTGRYIAIELYPYSFYEYCVAKKHKIKDTNLLDTASRALRKKWLNEYQKEGGFPEYLENEKTEYLTMLYESIIYRDIINRYHIPNERPIKELVLFLSSNIGKMMSYGSLKNTLSLASGTTVAEYCHYLENCYMFFLVHRYDLSVKRQLLAPKKCYVIDTAMAQILGFRSSEDKGRFLENMVFIELKRRNAGDIFYHQGKNECDFVLQQGITVTHAIQVTQTLHEKATKEREYAGLLEAMQTYQLTSGLILTENENYEDAMVVNNKTVTIKVQPLWEWLLLSDTSKPTKKMIGGE